MSDLFVCIGVSVALFCVCIAGCTFILGEKISDLTHEIWELRMDLREMGEHDEQADY